MWRPGTRDAEAFRTVHCEGIVGAPRSWLDRSTASVESATLPKRNVAGDGKAGQTRPVGARGHAAAAGRILKSGTHVQQRLLSSSRPIISPEPNFAMPTNTPKRSISTTATLNPGPLR